MTIKGGRRPKPTQLRVLHGDRPNRINDDEPPARDGLPTCPPGLSAAVRAVWKYTIGNLVVMGVATPADRDALVCYCEAVVSHRSACKALAADGILTTGAMGGTVTHPAFKIQREAAATIRAYAAEFGFTPSARSEIRRGAASHRSETDAARYLNA